MSQPVTIRPATDDDFPSLPALEIDAARAYEAIGWNEIAAMPPISTDDYLQNRAQQHVLVAEIAGSSIVGFCVLRTLDAQGFIHEIGVSRAFAQKGIGRALLDAAIHWARDQNYAYLLLTTFADAPFNAPFYMRYGFTPVVLGDHFPDLARNLKSERGGILGNYTRLGMQYRL